MTTLHAENVLGARAAHGLLSSAELYFQDCNFKKYMRGATYMRMEDCLSLQSMLGSDDTVTLRVSETTPVELSRCYASLWPKVLVWIHPAECNYGARFHSLPALRSRTINTQLLWFLLGMLSIIPEIWLATVNSLRFTAQWNGWFLRYTTCQIFNITKKVPKYEGSKHRFQETKFKIHLLMEKLGFVATNFVFEPCRMADVFSNMHASVAVLPFSRNTIDNFWTLISQNTEACIMYRDVNSDIEDIEGSMPYELKQPDQNLQFQLVWVGFESLTNAGSTWKGTIFVRHGNGFEQWWQQERGGKSCHFRRVHGNKIVANWRMLRFIVVVRRKQDNVLLPCIFCFFHNLNCAFYIFIGFISLQYILLVTKEK